VTESADQLPSTSLVSKPALPPLIGLFVGAVALWLVWEVRGVNDALARAAAPSAAQVSRPSPSPTITKTKTSSAKSPAGAGTRRARPAFPRVGSATVLSSIDVEECLAQVRPKEFPHGVAIDDLRQQLGFAWGSTIPLDPRTGRPTDASTLWDRYGGSVQAKEPTGNGGWVVVPQPGRNVPAGQLPPSYWENKRAELTRLRLCVERARLARSLFDPLWEQRELVGMVDTAEADEADEER
jgi:hypothetical protein